MALQEINLLTKILKVSKGNNLLEEIEGSHEIITLPFGGE